MKGLWTYQRVYTFVAGMVPATIKSEADALYQKVINLSWSFLLICFCLYWYILDSVTHTLGHPKTLLLHTSVEKCSGTLQSIVCRVTCTYVELSWFWQILVDDIAGAEEEAEEAAPLQDQRNTATSTAELGAEDVPLFFLDKGGDEKTAKQLKVLDIHFVSHWFPQYYIYTLIDLLTTTKLIS